MKYKVLMAESVPAYTEIEVEAESQEQAEEKAMALFVAGDYDASNSEPGWSESEEPRVASVILPDGMLVEPLDCL